MELIPYQNSEERNYAMLCHLSALAGFVIPFGNIIGPLIVWLLKRNEYAEVDRQGKDALNFQISMTIYAIVSAMLIIILIGILLVIAVGVLGLVVTIIASVKSSNGERYQYPLSIPFIQ